ncbi:hypothetical protein [Paracoccus sp. (in: a-proteobacteria)]|uniref:hypothetical protein n=1 Tax=Paracoccus sp. TaxID=267 RepID=UPI0028AA04CB|nr:hypothetical protein [Paracoccus sp. (in: a-proteobacteria)]
MTLLSFAAPFAPLVLGFVVSVSAGAVGGDDMMSPDKPVALTALLVAAAFFTLQAILWVRLGASL